MFLHKTTANSITKLAIFLQITLLKTLVSSPEALEKVLDGMVLKGTIQPTIAYDIKLAIKPIQLSTKLKGLFELVKKLRSEQPSTWRMVVFTTYKETQTTIKCFLESYGISCGLINGDSNSRNQESIEKFKKDQPEINVLISTEAGSEGVNLQVANVLVNYDLPWNPMVVEQRIGRIQRLSSKHANVCIFNIILKGTFEEYIVGRLMEKLQMASHAVGDIESLLEATGITEEEGSGSFEHKIRKLVMDSLAGKDVAKAIKLSEQSISDAKAKLESEKNNINAMLGGSFEQLDYGPTSPKLSKPLKSMDYPTLVLNAFKNFGSQVEATGDEQYIIKSENTQKTICFDSNKDGILYAPGSPDFENLVSKLTSSGLHCVIDNDQDALPKSENISREWVLNFGANFNKLELQKVSRCFSGKSTMRVRATVAHDSYERIIEVECNPTEHFVTYPAKGGIDSVQGFIENPVHVGVVSDKLSDTASKDADILEFCRFYLERREREMNAAGDDFAKRKKLEDEFTPRVEISLVGLAGNIYRELEAKISYNFEPNVVYQSILTITPSTGNIKAPKTESCAKTGKIVPHDCLHKCEISNELVLKHLLIKSEISNRLGLPEHMLRCALSGKLILFDEAEKSEITGNLISKSLLKTSSLSGKKAEEKFFVTCAFTNTEVLENEVKVSQISGKKYRSDEELSSVISGKNGHKSEFIFCSETKQILLLEESEKCEVTGVIVKPGILEKCDITGKMVMPSELDISAATGKKALKKLFISSSISNAILLETEAVISITRKFCMPSEAKICNWDENKYHPDDLGTCSLTGLSINHKYLTNSQPHRSEALINLLNGISNKYDCLESWNKVTDRITAIIGKGNYKVKAAELSPSKNCIAVSIESKAWIGLKTRCIGVLYSLQEDNVIGRIATGKIENRIWISSN
ncbi:MAG: hypothetical protein KGQ36_05825 [Rickettsiales bacterium]|nr:hypothetical protein [Rickettsiales bacterium]